MTPGRDAPRAAALNALALAALYALTRARIQTWETIAQVARVTGDPLLAERYVSTRLFHPQHLLYLPFALPLDRAMTALGLARDPFLPLQLVSAACGAVAAFVAGRNAVRLGVSERRALVVTLAAGLAAAPWQYSTEIAAIMPALAALLIAWWLALGRRPVASGIAIGFAVLMHQLAALPAAALLVGWVLAARRGETGAREVTRFALAAAIPVALAYLAVGLRYAHASTPALFARWLVTAGHRATFAPEHPLAIAFQTLRGGIESVVSLEPLVRWRAGGPVVPAALAIAALALVALALIPALPGAAGRLRHASPFAQALALAGLVLVPFVGWYQPWNHVFWVFLPALGAILAAVLMPPPGRRRALIPLAIGVLALSNLIGAQLPRRDPSRAPYVDLVEFGRLHFHAGDLLIADPGRTVLGEGLVALPYFARVEFLGVPAPDDRAGEMAFAANVTRALGQRRDVYVMPEALSAVERIHPVRADTIGLLRGAVVIRVAALEVAAGGATDGTRPTASPDAPATTHVP